MNHLIALSFPNEAAAQETLSTLQGLQQEHLIDLEDAAIVVKKPNGNAKLIQSFNLTAAGAVSGTFWGTLIGLLFLSPLLGAAVGAATGAMTGALTDIGINDDFMRSLGNALTPGTAALFILVRSATPDKVAAALRPFQGQVLQTNLSFDDENQLRELLEGVRG